MQLRSGGAVPAGGGEVEGGAVTEHLRTWPTFCQSFTLYVNSLDRLGEIQAMSSLHARGVVMRNNSVRVDENAFNRGVEEVLTLKPLVRAASKIYANMTGHAHPVKREASSGKTSSQLVKK